MVWYLSSLALKLTPTHSSLFGKLAVGSWLLPCLTAEVSVFLGLEPKLCDLESLKLYPSVM